MAQCLNVCGCDDLEGISKTDLDRFTDKIEHVLADERGRRLFSNFMITSKMKDGKKSLAFWERCELMLTSSAKSSGDAQTNEHFVERVNKLIDDADKIEDLDFATVERLMTARDEMNTGNKESVRNAVKTLQNEVKKTMSQEFTQFRKYYVDKFT